MLRAIRVGHAFATRELWDVCEQLPDDERRFAAVRRASELTLGTVADLSAAMAREFGQVQQTSLASANAARMEVVRGILYGDAISVEHASRVLGYDLTRHHVAFVAWADDLAEAGATELEGAVVELLGAAGCTASLVLPVGDRRVWGWRSGVHRPCLPPAHTSRAPGSGSPQGWPHRRSMGSGRATTRRWRPPGSA
ncbi:hypothetical protein [Streptomyces sp. NPDC096311]|uniref:hypothetical protein n=1 Tax=Streptomyces sp. NPDC096311 TaxID=3366083 RepID=UPI003802C744